MQQYGGTPPAGQLGGGGGGLGITQLGPCPPLVQQFGGTPPLGHPNGGLREGEHKV